MPRPRLFSIKFLTFALLPVVLLIVAGEWAVRVKYFLAHGRDWQYLLHKGESLAPKERWRSPKDQMVFAWSKPCANTMVFSTEAGKALPRTFDGNCFRGDAITTAKPGNEYRVMFVGGSTVEDYQADADMMTAHFKRALAPPVPGKTVRVVNAGKIGFESKRILLYWTSWLKKFSPDMVLYYEAWNEQPSNVTWSRADDRIAKINNRVHRALYNRWSLYTYLVEKYVFATTTTEHFWKADTDGLDRHFVSLANDVRATGARFVFVTQAVKFPRMWKGVDTFDHHAVEALLDRLKADRGYTYDAVEISALNQRRSVAYTVEICRRMGIPVVDILAPIEMLGEDRRAELFMDLGHLSAKGDRIIGELIASRLADAN